MAMSCNYNPAHVSTSSTTTTTPTRTATARASSPPKRQEIQVRCSSFLKKPKPEGRRLVSVSLLLLPLLSPPQHANAGSIFDKYIKRKKLEPLEDYVPAVILTQLQFQDLDKLKLVPSLIIIWLHVLSSSVEKKGITLQKILEVDQPQYADCRSLLRSGPASSFRANVRAVAQYASEGGMGKVAFDSVDQCLRALEELDSLLLHASRNDPEASVKLMKGQIAVAPTALDSLLQTVPSDVLEKGKAIADAYRAPVADDEPLELDPDLKQLESIL